MTALFYETKLRILRRHEVVSRTGLAISTIYDKLNPRSPRYDPTFPKQKRLGLNSKAVGWLESDINLWLQNCQDVC